MASLSYPILRHIVKEDLRIVRQPWQVGACHLLMVEGTRLVQVLVLWVSCLGWIEVVTQSRAVFEDDGVPEPPGSSLLGDWLRLGIVLCLATLHLQVLTIRLLDNNISVLRQWRSLFLKRLAILEPCHLCVQAMLTESHPLSLAVQVRSLT